MPVKKPTKTQVKAARRVIARHKKATGSRIAGTVRRKVYRASGSRVAGTTFPYARFGIHKWRPQRPKQPKRKKGAGSRVAGTTKMSALMKKQTAVWRRLIAKNKKGSGSRVAGGKWDVTKRVGRYASRFAKKKKGSGWSNAALARAAKRKKLARKKLSSSLLFF